MQTPTLRLIVANERQLRAISQNESKTDRSDAEMLARLANSDPKLLSPIHHRSVERQRDLDLIHARNSLARARTMLINTVRGLVRVRAVACHPAPWRTSSSTVRLRCQRR
jgi:transposase